MPKKICGFFLLRNFLTKDNDGRNDEHSGCNLHNALLLVVARCYSTHSVAVLASFEMAELLELHNFLKSEARLLL